MWVADPKKVRTDNFAEYVANNQDAVKRGAEARMKDFDALPRDLRDVVKQYGCLSAAKTYKNKDTLLKYVQFNRSLTALWLTKDGTAVKRTIADPTSRHTPPTVAKSIPKTGRARSTKSAMELFK